MKDDSMTDRLAIYHPAGRVGLGQNVFGKDVANFDLFRALVRQSGLSQVDFLTNSPIEAEALARSLDATAPDHARIETANILDDHVACAAGTLLRGGPRIEEQAWQRRRVSGDSAYSLMGLIHTIAPPAMRQEIAQAAIAPMHPWDALICTSPSVQSAMVEMFDEWADYLGERFNGDRRTRPMLPLLPLGVDGQVFADHAARPDVRRAERDRLGMADDDILVLWVGRLSFFEKAFPQPMLRAVQEAGRQSGRRMHFAMAGWFPDQAEGERQYGQAAAAHAPDCAFHIIDGNDRSRLSGLWAAADIFLSLVDNIQETFGITPLEAMAAGLPVVVSDWDGYRYTVRNGQEGFLVPTLIGPEAVLPDAVVAGHALGLKSYQQYVGIIAQYTAVDIGFAATAIASLAASPDLRCRMGEAGQRRVRDMFDWAVVAPQYRALAAELAVIRSAHTRQAPPTVARRPVKGDPFRDFAGFASSTLKPETRLRLRGEAGLEDLRRASKIELDMFAANWRSSLNECAAIINRLGEGREASVVELLALFPPSREPQIQLSLLWLCKLGLVAWDEPI
jgi:glycosyltransferase involved in cell wall biosynthesis